MLYVTHYFRLIGIIDPNSTSLLLVDFRLTEPSSLHGPILMTSHKSPVIYTITSHKETPYRNDFVAMEMVGMKDMLGVHCVL